MRELFRQRQRELAAERAQFAADSETDEDAETLETTTETAPKLEQVTLPPPPKTDDQPVVTPPKTETTSPKSEPPPPTSRPREVEPQKKKGKKGDDEP